MLPGQLPPARESQQVTNLNATPRRERENRLRTSAAPSHSPSMAAAWNSSSFSAAWSRSMFEIASFSAYPHSGRQRDFTHASTLDTHSSTLDTHSSTLDTHSSILDTHSSTLERNSSSFFAAWIRSMFEIESFAAWQGVLEPAYNFVKLTCWVCGTNSSTLERISSSLVVINGSRQKSTCRQLEFAAWGRSTIAIEAFSTYDRLIGLTRREDALCWDRRRVVYHRVYLSIRRQNHTQLR